MPSTTFTLRIDPTIKKRLEKLAKNTGRSRSYLAAQALAEYVELNEWQVAGIKAAATSLDKGEGVPHADVRSWIESWDQKKPRPAPKRAKV